MSHTLEYTTHVIVPRRSRLTLVALGIGVLGMPLLYIIYRVLDHLGVNPLLTGLIVIILYLIFPMIGMVTGIVALKRVAASNGRLRGHGFGIAAIAASLLMPLLFLWAMSALFH